MARIVDTSPKPPRIVDTSPKPPRIDPAELAAALGAEIFDGPHPLARPTVLSPLPSVPAAPAEAVTPPPARKSA